MVPCQISSAMNSRSIAIDSAWRTRTSSKGFFDVLMARYQVPR